LHYLYEGKVLYDNQCKIKKMKKLTKKSLDEMAKTMNVIPEDERDNYWGMYDGDCFWRCVAWLETGDSSEAAAASYALAYWADMMGGNTVNAHSILSTGGAGMNLADAKSYVQANSIGGSNQKIYLINPDAISGYDYSSISGAMHAVVYTGSRNSDGSYNMFDTQTNTSFVISESEANTTGNMYLVR
jgi:hypothetical protein